jgi:hypothetical protein
VLRAADRHFHHFRLRALHNWLAPDISVASYVGVQSQVTAVMNEKISVLTSSDEVEDKLSASAPAALLRNTA